MADLINKQTKQMKKGAKNTDKISMKHLRDKEKKTDPPLHRRYRIRLKTTEDVRRMLSVTLNSLRRGEIDVQTGRALIYGGQVMLNVFEQGNLANQLKELQERVREYD